MDNEKRTLLAITLSMVILLVYQVFFTPESKKQEIQEPVNQEENIKISAPKPITPPRMNIQKIAAETRDNYIPTDRTEDDIIVHTKMLTAVMTKYGARLKSVKLNNYKERIKPPAIIKLKNKFFSSSKNERVENLTESKEILYPEKNPFDMPLRASFITQDGTIYPDSNWSVSSDASNHNIKFTQNNPEKLTIQKILQFNDDDYRINFTLKFKNDTSQTQSGSGFVEWAAPLQEGKGGGLFSGAAISDVPRFSYFINNEIEKKNLTDIEEEIIIEGKVSWTAIEEKYFTSILVPLSENPAQVRASKKNEDTVTYKLLYPFISLNPGEEKTYSFFLYIGPKDIDILSSQNALLEKTINFGWFDIIAKPLLLSLKFFYKYIGNYGLAIILITIIIKILFWPLANKSFKSMKGMQSIQPEIAKLKEKYKDNKEEFAKQQMALYKQYNVNPLGGCLPMLLQIPVFISLYRVLADSIELRHADFITFWINDLSAKDPTYIAPLLMGASMFLQQKMTPSAADPTQAKMMMFMPLIFTVMFLSFPSGLVIYWLLNNVLSIAQQLYINKKSNVPGGNECSPSKPKQKQSKKQLK
jgi:YidC/Oxa1 family membrane protein insertase